jgi:hypothetical protein
LHEPSVGQSKKVSLVSMRLIIGGIN